MVIGRNLFCLPNMFNSTFKTNPYLERADDRHSEQGIHISTK